MNLAHRMRINSQNRGPYLPRCWKFACSCGTESPWAADKNVAKLAQTDHIRQHRLEDVGA